MGMTPLLHVEGLVRAFGTRRVVDIDSLSVMAGEIVAVLGPNGAGKSTLFRTLLLLEPADGGRIAFDGRTIRAGDTAAMRRMAGVFQRPFAFAGTVADNVAYGLRVRGVGRAERRSRALEALDWLGVAQLAGAPMHALSGGEQQRVALARALVLEPDLLLLDEPSANLDITVRRRFREDLERTVRQHARAVLLITHDAGDAFALADRIAVMESGRITQLGAPEDLVVEPASPFVAAFAGAELLLDGTVRSVEDGLVTIALPGGAHAVAAAGVPARLRAGQAVHLAYRPEDVTLSAHEAPTTSARNGFAVRVAALVPAGGLVRVRLSGVVPLVALVTRDSVARLGLEVGAETQAWLKASALRVYAAGTE